MCFHEPELFSCNYRWKGAGGLQTLLHSSQWELSTLLKAMMMELVMYSVSPHPGFHCKSGRFRLRRPSGHKKASLTFRLLQRWNTCVMKKGWDSLFGEKRLRSVREKKAWEWNQSLHYMTDNAWCDGSRKLRVHPWWCTWLHFACLVGQIFTRGNFRALPSPFFFV